MTLYAVTLLTTNYHSERQLHEAASQRMQLETDELGHTLGFLASQWKNDIKVLAGAPELTHYFTNKALKMSMSYGLRANLYRIRKLLVQFVKDRSMGDTPLVMRAVFVDTEGTVLADTDLPAQSGPAPPQWLQLLADPQPDARLITDVPGPELLLTAPFYFKSEHAGQLLVWFSAATVSDSVLRSTDSRDATGHYVLTDAGRVVLPPRLDSKLRSRLSEEFQHARRTGVHVFEGAQGFAPDRTLAGAVSRVPGTPLWATIVRPAEEVFPARTSWVAMIALAALPLLFASSYLLVWRFRRATQLLQERFDLSARQRDLLEQEVRRREQIEAELRDKQAQVLRQTSELQKAMDEAHRLAFYDGLTGLANRLLFRDRFEQALLHARRERLTVALLFLDLDRFKRINDTLGHHIGDLLLKEIAQRMECSIRSSDCIAPIAEELEVAVARQGGDEFTVLLLSVRHPQDASKVAQRLIEAISTPMTLEGYEVSVTTSVGIALFPSDGSDTTTLIRNADAAMYNAKERGGNTFRFYESPMNAVALQRLQVESELRRALQRDELEVYFQPQIEVPTATVVGVEALVRWRHPERGLVPPGEFIPTAEETGLIVQLTELVLHQACTRMVALHKRTGRSLRVAVNLSGYNFFKQDVYDLVIGVLDDTGLAPSLLEVELTESMLMENREEATETLRRLKQVGVQTSIDDFGTGYSSLSYLKSFPIQCLKIDRSFIRNLETDANDAAIVRTITAMAHSLGLKTVAEGVETPAQLEFLRQLGCEIVQGYLYSPPLPFEDLVEYLTNDTTKTSCHLRPALATAT